MSAALRKRRRKLIVPRGALLAGEAAEPPYSAVSRLDAGAHRLRHVAAVAVTLGAHAAIALAVVSQHRADERPPAPVHREITATITRLPPPPPPAPPPPPPAPRPPAHVAARAPQRAPPATPPPPAQAGRAIAVEGPANMTSFDLVVGQGTSYAGGSSSAKGTSREAVHETAQVGASPRKLAAADLSRPAEPLDLDWACPWPDEAQDSDLREARVTVRVRISASGDASAVDVLQAPAQGGLAEGARHCALIERYRPARDASGNSIAAERLFSIHFTR